MTLVQSIIFLIGLAGFFAVGTGLWLIYPPVALVTCGGVAFWWSWYVTVGVHLHRMPKPEAEQ